LWEQIRTGLDGARRSSELTAATLNWGAGVGVGTVAETLGQGRGKTQDEQSRYLLQRGQQAEIAREERRLA
jgi:hypothetical protein